MTATIEPAADARLALRRHLSVQVVAGEAVYLVADTGVSVLNGALATALAPLLDGTRTEADVHQALPGVASERIERALRQLERGGMLARTARGVDHASAGYFEACGLDGDHALDALGAARVRVVGLGDVDVSAVSHAVHTAGLTSVTDDETLLVVVTDEYTNSDLEEINAEALRSGRPWLLARTSGASLWIGPVFRPGRSACWQCLATRLHANQQALTYLRHCEDRSEVIGATTHLPIADSVAAALIATEVVREVIGALTEAPAVRVLDLMHATTETHELVRRPQCAACGDAELQARLMLAPVELHPRAKVYTGDGGHRATTPEQMLATYRRQLSPITGVVTALVPAAGGFEGMHVFVAGQNLARHSDDLSALRRGLRSLSAGKGKTEAQARASALGEGMERYSGVFRGDEPTRRASMSDLGEAAIDPRTAMLFSEQQYSSSQTPRDRESVTSSFYAVPKRFDPDRPRDWSPAWSLTEQRTVWLPTAYLYFNAPIEDGSSFADSNGNAGGTSAEDAVLQGFLELVERDAVSVWWYNRLRRPALDLDSFDDPYVTRMRIGYGALNREIWALDLTSDLGIPVVGAFSRRTDKHAEDIIIAFGAHLDPHVAMTRALSELNQFLGPATARADGSYLGNDPEQVQWWRTATVANQPHLQPHAALVPTTSDLLPHLATDDLLEDVTLCHHIVEARGMHMIVADQTRPDIGLPVAKVIVPGMRHFWNRRAPGRLYDVPVQLGWSDTPTAEHDLNPIPIFI